MNLLNRSGLAAIAAATAFLATPALAQDAAPVAADSAPIVADTPLSSEPAGAPVVASDTLAPVAAPKAAKSVKTTRVASTARPVAPVRSVARTAAPAIVAAPMATPVAPIAAPADAAMVAPLPEPVAAAPVTPAATTASNDDLLPIAGAAGLGILALAGAGFAMRRRRRDDDVVVEENWVEPQHFADAPMATAPIAAAPIPAFAWGDPPTTTAPAVAAPAPAPGDMNWIEAAKRGPTPDNPSASLKKRLSRAAFFVRREKLVAAGKATAVSPMAGLPDAMDAPTQTARTEPAMRMGFNRRLQPA